jgi:hypothetical protein
MIAWAIAMPNKLLSASIADSSRSHADRARAAPSRFTISYDLRRGLARPFFQMIIGHLRHALPRISLNGCGAACTPPRKLADCT